MYIEPTTKIWLETQRTTFLIPVNPAKINIEQDAPEDTFKIVGRGQVAVPQNANLKKVKWESFLPGIESPFTDGVFDIAYFVREIENVMLNAETCVFKMESINGTETFNCIIKSFTHGQEGGNLYDVPYTIEVKEWRNYAPEIIEINTTKKVSKTKKQRKSKPVLTVGAKVIVNGKYYYDSYGSEPHGTAKNLNTYVKRIVPGRDYPVLIGNNIGWTKESNLQIKG